MNNGNFSASEHYSVRRNEFRRKKIDPKKIKKRWFRNFYVLEQSRGYFNLNTFVMEFGKFDPNEYKGEWYGPFTSKDAYQFAYEITRLHDWFITS